MNKNLRKMAALILMTVMAMCFAACGSSGEPARAMPETESPASAESPASEAESAETEDESPEEPADTTGPVLEAKGTEFPLMESISVDDIVTATDETDEETALLIIACDGDAEVAAGGESVIFRKSGTYNVGVMATDSAGNSTKGTVEVKAVNRVLPEIALSETTVGLGDSQTAYDFRKLASASSPVYGDLTDSITMDDSAVQFGVPGTYEVVYHVADPDGNEKGASLEVVIRDTTGPVLHLPVSEFSLTAGDGKPDYLAGVTAEDKVDGDLSSKVQVDDLSVNYEAAGTYTVVFLVADAADNLTKAEASVVVEPTPEPTVAPTPEPKNTYILNTNTKKFHYPWCSSVNKMKDKNKQEYTGTRDEVMGMGYVPCQRCNP